MKKAIILRSLAISLAIVLIATIFSVFILQNSKEQQIADEMERTLEILIKTNEIKDPEEAAGQMAKLADARITIVDATGLVVGDSDTFTPGMDNHAERPEIVAAMNSGYGMALRQSDTKDAQLLYIALKRGDYIYRISEQVSTLRTSVADMFPSLLVGILAAVVVAPFLSRSLAKSITRPMLKLADQIQEIGNGAYGKRVEDAAYEELEPVVRTVNGLTQNISSTLRELENQKKKTEHLLNSMEDGLVLLSGTMEVLQANDAACRLLEVSRDLVGKNLIYLTRDQEILDAAAQTVSQECEHELDVDLTDTRGIILSVHLSPVRFAWLEQGAVMLIRNVTQIRQTERIRSEFIANASHELKTPITSVRGFAELLSAGVVTDPNKVEEYLGRIMSESDRMTGIIQDILRLSSLESRKGEQQMVNIDLSRQCQEILKSLAPQLEQKKINVSLTGQLSILAEETDVYQMLRNLIDNALKYNVEGGKISIVLSEENAKKSIIISDTGIGIPTEHQARVFERFYRVDKGRSRMIGGTGLGLAIVKHTVAKYGGDIQLESREGHGTTIRITF